MMEMVPENNLQNNMENHPQRDNGHQGGARSSSILDSPKGLYVLIGIGLLWKAFLLFSSASKAPNTDGVIYMMAAKAMTEGRFLDSLNIYPMPAYPAMLALLHSLGMEWSLSGRIISSLFLLLAQIPIYQITRRWFGPRAAFWATLAFMLPYFSNKMAVSIYRGPPFIFFFLVAIYALLITLETPNTRRMLAAFSLSLVPFCFRIEGAFIIPLFPLALLFYSVREKGLKGLPQIVAFLWLVSIVAIGLMFFGAPIELNRLSSITETVNHLVHLDFLHQYKEIYHQIESLEPLSPDPSQNQNFAEIARHFLWLIYLIGLIQCMAATFYPFYLIPLFYGLKGTKMDRERSFVCLTFFIYFLILYFHIITHDYSGKRFVWGAVSLLYPWVGIGSVILLNRPIKPIPKWIYSAIFLALFFFPVAKYPRLFERPDHVSVEAGMWLANSPCKGLRMIGNDIRIPFIAGIPIEGMDKGDIYKNFVSDTKEYAPIEGMALEEHRDLIILKLPVKKSLHFPRFSKYILIRKFQGKRRIVGIFGTPKAARLCGKGGGIS